VQLWRRERRERKGGERMRERERDQRREREK